LTLTGFALYNQGLTTGDLIMNNTTATAIGYVGAIVMALFSFTMLPAIAILGLALLTVQMTYARIWNLVILNLVSIGGFAVQLMGA
jgi:hypothetical protein